MNSEQVLVLPGWQNSGPQHWQSLWQDQFGYQRVAQHDWQRPLRGDWITRLEEVILATPGPLVLVAHSLGCQLVAAWAAVSRSTARIQGALLVAPADTECDELRQSLHSWCPVVRQPLGFAATVVASANDPYCSLARASTFANAWGASWVNIGAHGHVNAESGLEDWPQGQALLQDLIAR